MAACFPMSLGVYLEAILSPPSFQGQLFGRIIGDWGVRFEEREGSVAAVASHENKTCDCPQLSSGMVGHAHEDILDLIRRWICRTPWIAVERPREEGFREKDRALKIQKNRFTSY
jgi:hypothetical protein